MPSSTLSSRTPARIPALLLLLVSVFGSLLVSTAGPASAATPGTAAVHEASRHQGQPYHYGSAGPTRFDCSGFTLYVFKHFGKSLPHSSVNQYSSSHVQHISKANKRPGDIIFIRNSSNRIYHVGIYAGNGKFWHAPKSGDHVRLAAIYTSNYVVGRVR